MIPKKIKVYIDGIIDGREGNERKASDMNFSDEYNEGYNEGKERREKAEKYLKKNTNDK